MGKMKDGLNKTKLTKKEENLTKLSREYENGTLTRQDFQKIPENKKMEYLNKMIKQKYNIEIKTDCLSCGSCVLFEDSGCISDEDLLSNVEIRKKFHHV